MSRLAAASSIFAAAAIALAAPARAEAPPVLLPAHDAADRFLAQAQAMRFRRIGQERVAGLPCTDWSVHGPKGGGAGDACITADGLILRAHGGGQGVDGSLVATSVQEAAQPDALFAVPAGYALLGTLPGRRS